MSSSFLINYPHKLSRSRSKGFTLVELVAVVTIMGLMSGIGVMATMSARQNRQVAMVTDKLKSIISETRYFALARPLSLSNAQNIIILINTNNTINFYKDSVSPANLLNPPLIADTTIPGNIKFTQSYTITIDAHTKNQMGNITQINSSTPPYLAPIVISDPSSNNTYNLNIDQFGGIDAVRQ